MSAFHYVTDLDFTRESGGVVHALGLARALSDLGRQVLLYGGGVPEDLRAATEEGAQSGEMPRPARGRFAMRRYRTRLARAVVANLREGDALYLRGPWPELHGLSSQACERAVLEANGCLVSELEFAHAPWWRRLKARRFEAQGLRRAARIAAVSAGIRRELVARYRLDPEKVAVTGNGSDPARFFPRDRQAARARFGLPHEALILGFVGGFWPWTALEPWFLALTLLGEMMPWHMVLAGDGPSRAALQKRARALLSPQRMTWLPTLPRDEVPELMAAFDLGLEARDRRTPAAPLKVFEYLAMGVPICAVLREDFLPWQRQGLALLADNDLPFVLACVLRDYHAGGVLLSGREAIVSSFRAHHTWRHVAERTLALFDGA